ncbi:MAG: hypothetical protein ACK4GL_12090, partial [Flavobacteriales bacterium]
YTSGNRLVYGGGGIMPDVFIPLDTTENSKYLTDLYRKGLFNRFVLKYVDNNRDQLKRQFPEFASYKKDFKVSDQLLNDFFALGETEEIKRDDEGIAKSGEFIRRQLRALIANQIWGVNEFYECINESNPIVTEALKVMNSDAFRKMKIKF